MLCIISGIALHGMNGWRAVSVYIAFGLGLDEWNENDTNTFSDAPCEAPHLSTKH